MRDMVTRNRRGRITGSIARALLFVFSLGVIVPCNAQELQSPKALAVALQAILQSDDMSSIANCLVYPENASAIVKTMQAALKGTDHTKLVVHPVPANSQEAIDLASAEYTARGGSFRSLETRLQEERDAGYNVLFGGTPAYAVAPLGDLLIVADKRIFAFYYGKSGGKYLITQSKRQKAPGSAK
jgi:hypothetical protein